MDGAKAQDESWPAFHKSLVHSSPLVFDFDEDGILDILMPTFNGEILVAKDTVGVCQPISSAYVFACVLCMIRIICTSKINIVFLNFAAPGRCFSREIGGASTESEEGLVQGAG